MANISATLSKQLSTKLESATQSTIWSKAFTCKLTNVIAFFQRLIMFHQFFRNDKGEGNHINPILKVAGCGKNKGLQIVLDSHRLSSFMPEGKLSKGFKVFLTLPGVTTSKMPFLINPTFKGEHNLILHGIHDVKVTASELMKLPLKRPLH